MISLAESDHTAAVELLGAGSRNIAIPINYLCVSSFQCILLRYLSFVFSFCSHITEYDM